ncbi:MAG: alanine racemase [Nanobdellota archaeon]
MFQTSWLELDKEALKHNINFIRKITKSRSRISSVVKGNAYGHGIEQFVPMAEELGIDHFAVYCASEARRVKIALSRDSDIMIMGSVDEMEWTIDNGIEFFVFDIDRLNEALEVAKRLGKPAKIHIEIETGMNRTGFVTKELKEVVRIIRENPDHFIIKGICTHYSGAESISNYYRVKKQIKRFRKKIKWLNNKDVVAEYNHSACSAALISFPETQMDLVRVGILQYGSWPSPETKIGYLNNKEDKTSPIKRVISWKSRILTTKRIKAGDFIGYGVSYIAHDDMRTAIIPVGYAYGYSRSLSNNGRVIINGYVAEVIGIVNMNCLIVNITDIEAKKGDEVVLIGEQGERSISVASFSDFNNQLNYELLVRLDADIPRYVV